MGYLQSTAVRVQETPQLDNVRINEGSQPRPLQLIVQHEKELLQPHSNNFHAVAFLFHGNQRFRFSGGLSG